MQASNLVPLENQEEAIEKQQNLHPTSRRTTYVLYTSFCFFVAFLLRAAVDKLCQLTAPRVLTAARFSQSSKRPKGVRVQKQPSTLQPLFTGFLAIPEMYPDDLGERSELVFWFWPKK